MKSDVISRTFHGKLAAVAMFALAAFYIVASGSLDSPLPSQGDQGIGLQSPSYCPLSRWASLGISVGFNLLIMLLMLLINKTYNVLRAVTWLPIGLFAIMQGAIPRQVLTLNSGSFVCLVIVLCLFMMFSTYDSQSSVRTVFMTFLLLSVASATQYCFIFFIPVFWIICLQMRVLTLRGFVGSVLGILTVWINLLGFGIVDPAGIRFPTIGNIFSSLDLRTALYLVTLTGLTVLMLMTSILANVMKTIAYNARARAYNGALLIVSLTAIIAMVFDYDNCLAYVPLLNFSASYQITHYFVNHRYERQYIAVLAVVGVYIALYLWRLSL